MKTRICILIDSLGLQNAFRAAYTVIYRKDGDWIFYDI